MQLSNPVAKDGCLLPQVLPRLGASVSSNFTKLVRFAEAMIGGQSGSKDQEGRRRDWTVSTDKLEHNASQRNLGLSQQLVQETCLTDTLWMVI